ncbi:unnamed protein product [Didymodactylos carnosus]|uniref:MULE transposase domain-containing protein n=1 Tax=Didymodactylos carnosus TaxID=1234261 RepID=A0A816AJ37_9BILA|nr:unnamed protein product [Didymodactylos carnosus]CAF1596891.1 unnamed protein product [Didymodactylos carnosus]CAF4074242.1 unnamed protein product [Didymodactylos carnosus]CAF4471997.1 unnamed protein product [Didymodactylos carnosus]
MPRDLLQIHNARKVAMKVLLSRKDELLNLHYVAMAMPSLVWKLETVPDLLLVLSEPDLCNEINKLWGFKSTDQAAKQLFYDTTFSIGDYFVSPLLTKINCFDEEPTVPFSILIHRNQTTESHITHFLTMKLNKKPSLKRLVDDNIFITHDREDAITNSISFVFPQWTQFSDYVHLKRNLKTHCRKEQIGKDLRKRIFEYIDILQLSETLEQFDDTYDELSKICPEDLLKYIDNNLKEVLINITVFTLRSHGYLCSDVIPYSNRCEGFNFMLKQLNEWKKSSVDAVVLSFHRLLAHFLIDIRRSRAGLGKYHLKSIAARYALDTDDIEDEPKISMNDIVKELQADLY